MKLIVCKKEKCQGIFAQITGDKLLEINKRKNDKHPVRIKLTGKDYSLLMACTMCGKSEYVEIEDGKISNIDDLKVIERKDEDDGKEGKDDKDGKKDDTEGGDGKHGGADPNSRGKGSGEEDDNDKGEED